MKMNWVFGLLAVHVGFSQGWRGGNQILAHAGVVLNRGHV